MNKIEQINRNLSTECEYQSIRKRLSTNTYIWKVGDGKHSYSQRGKAELIKFIINTISHSLGFRLSIGLSFVRYKNKTTFVWCTVCGDHFICGGGRSPSPCGLRWSSATTNSVISSYSSPDCGFFVISSCGMFRFVSWCMHAQ